MIARGKLTMTGLPPDLGMVVFLGKPDPSAVRVVHPNFKALEKPNCHAVIYRLQLKK
jgi:hypothetical protein